MVMGLWSGDTLFENSQLTVIAEHHARGQSRIAKKIWLSIHARKFGSHVIVRPTVRPSVRLSETTGKPMLNFTLSS